MIKRHSRSPWLATALLLLAPTLALGLDTRTVETSIPTSARVVIENLAGRIEIEPLSGSDEVTIEATVHAEGRDDTETAEILRRMVWTEDDGRWALDYPIDEFRGFAYPEEGSWGSTTTTRFRGEKVKIYGSPKSRVPVLYADLVIGLPAGSRVEIRNASGSVRGERLSGELTIDTGRGDVDLAGFDGRLDVDTGSGDVELEEIVGRLRVDTGSGSVQVRGIDVRDLDIDTGSGDVRVVDGRAERAIVDTGSGEIELVSVDVEDFEGDTGSGDVFLEGDLRMARSIKVDTGSGDVTIVGGSGFEFDLRTSLGSGQVRVDYRDADLDRRDREVVGATRGSGRTRVDVDTGSGDCRLRETD